MTAQHDKHHFPGRIYVQDRKIRFGEQKETKKPKKMEIKECTTIDISSFEVETVDLKLPNQMPFTEDEYYRIFAAVKLKGFYPGVEYSDLMLKSRKRENVLTRQTIMYFMRKRFPAMSLNKIAQRMGGFDHSNIIHAIKQVENLCDSDKKFKNCIKDIEDYLNL